MKKSVFSKSIIVFAALSIFIVFAFSVIEVTIVSSFVHKIETIFRQSINNSCVSWSNQFYMANYEVKFLVDRDDTDSYSLLCGDGDNSDVVRAAAKIQNDLTNMSVINSSNITHFCYFPIRNLLLSSAAATNMFSPDVDHDLRNVLNQNILSNSVIWQTVVLGNEQYFIHVYEKNGGLSGSLIPCEKLIEGIIPEGNESYACLLNMDGSMFFGNENISSVSSFSYARPIRMINKKISIQIPYANFTELGPYLFAICIVAVLASIALLLLALSYQKRTVFLPLKKLEKAMINFSHGDTEGYLEGSGEKGEIATLYTSFNQMKKQIINLRISVYDAQLEKQKMYSDFLRVQIQPHFYTNILNLIHTLANAGECATIQKVTREMADYFRYVLSINKDYVSLSEELLCIRHYTDLQKMRYQQNFLLTVLSTVDESKEKIPPLMLQTFIENSIRHNVMIVRPLLIELSIHKENDQLFIRIEDNGVGIKPDVLQKLRRGESIEKDGQHIGIINVINRLQNLYHGKACVQLLQPDNGFVVEIVLPSSEGEEHHECVTD